MVNSRLKVAVGSSISCTHEVSALTLLLWDTALTAGQEYRVIWRRGCPTLMKWAFLLARYPSLVAQMANATYVWKHLSHAPLPIPSEICRSYFLFQMTVFRCLIFIFDIVLSVKVYTMYKQNPIVYRRIWFAVIAGTVVSLICGTQIRGGTKFDAVCAPSDIPMLTLGIAITMSLLRYALMAHLLLKKWFPNQGSIIQSPVIGKEALMTTLGIAGVVVSRFPYRGSTYTSSDHAVWIWPITLTSILCCRLILSLGAESTVSSVRLNQIAEVDHEEQRNDN